MKAMNITEKIKLILEPRKNGINARVFVTREDGITIYDSVQNQTTTSVSALVSGVWQASQALMEIAHPEQDAMEFRFAFDTSSQGIYLFPFFLKSKRYFLGALYRDCLNPGQLKRQMAMIKEEMDLIFQSEPVEVLKKVKTKEREGFLFQDISDDEIDRLFSAGGI
jgi:hypothetical protein